MFNQREHPIWLLQCCCLLGVGNGDNMQSMTCAVGMG